MSEPSERLADLLTRAAAELAGAVDGCGCAISRVVGDLLLLVAEHSDDGRTLNLGQGYLLSDYPQTREVLESRVPLAVALGDPEIDEGEAAVLRLYGFQALLMLPLVVGEQPWALVEIYRREGRFTESDAAVATEVAARVGAALAHP